MDHDITEDDAKKRDVINNLLDDLQTAYSACLTASANEEGARTDYKRAQEARAKAEAAMLKIKRDIMDIEPFVLAIPTVGEGIPDCDDDCVKHETCRDNP